MHLQIVMWTSRIHPFVLTCSFHIESLNSPNITHNVLVYFRESVVSLWFYQSGNFNLHAQTSPNTQKERKYCAYDKAIATFSISGEK